MAGWRCTKPSILTGREGIDGTLRAAVASRRRYHGVMPNEPWPNTDDVVRDRLRKLGVTREAWARLPAGARKAVIAASSVCAVIETAILDVLGASDDDRLRAKADAYLRSIHRAANRLDSATGSYTTERELAPRRAAARAAQQQVVEICREIAANGRQGRNNRFTDPHFIVSATKELNRRLPSVGVRAVAVRADVEALGPGHGGAARLAKTLLTRAFDLRQQRRSANRPNGGRRRSGAGRRL